MSKVIQNKGGIGMGAPYDIPGYEYDPVTDKFKDLATGKTFDKDGNAKLENSKSVSITENGNYEITPSATYDAMKKVALSVEVEGSADLEDNKEATIDVSAYTDPVEITPTEGKDGMKKVTVSLSNMPAGANMLYAWRSSESPNTLYYFNIGTSPVDQTAYEGMKTLYYGNTDVSVGTYAVEGDIYARVSDTEFTVSYEEDGQTTTNTFTRDATKDVEVWNAPPEVETTKQATIDVSTYDPSNKPVITPTAGKQSMGSVEITLDNIPSGGSGTAYAWTYSSSGDDHWEYFPFSIAPATKEEYDQSMYIGIDGAGAIVKGHVSFTTAYTKVSDTEMEVTFAIGGNTLTYTRDATRDIEVW